MSHCTQCEIKFVDGDEFYTISNTIYLCSNCNIITGLSICSKRNIYKNKINTDVSIDNPYYRRLNRPRPKCVKSSPFASPRRNHSYITYDRLISNLPEVKFKLCVKCKDPIYIKGRFIIVEKPSTFTSDKWEHEYSNIYGHRLCYNCCKKMYPPKMPYKTYELGTNPIRVIPP